MSNTVQYTDMKDSGIKWIGTIPSAWQISRIGSLYSLRNERVSDKDYAPLSVTMKGVVPQLATVAKTDDGDNRKLVCKGDFVINSRSDRRGSCGISPLDGSVSLINTVLAPVGEMHPGYYNWLFHTSMFADEFYQCGHGIVDDLWTTRWQEMKQILVPVPQFNEQEKISSYLDKTCRQIDAIIDDTLATVDEYKAWKQSVIYEAVTKGISKSEAIKDSGTEFGYIPKGWSAIRLKNISNSIYKGSGITKEDVVKDGEIPCIRYGEIYSKYNYFFEECLTRTNEDKVSSKKYFSHGDILFAGTGESVEEIGKNIAYLGKESCLAGGDIIVVRHEQNPVFLSFALNSFYCQMQKGRGKAKLKVVHISASDIGNLIVFLPPIEEQNIIADYLTDKCSIIDSSIAEKQELISELELYKRSLIYETVTGKRKVV